MLGAVEQVRNPAAINPRLLPAIDQLLVAGIKLGPNKKHEAINKILKLVPEWKRGDCWRCIRQLRRTPALAADASKEVKKVTDTGPSYRAVRFRLGALGMSARVTDGWSQRALRKLLRMSRTRLRQLVASGMLRVRDPRITAASLHAWCAKNYPATNPTSMTGTARSRDSEGPFSWKRAAKILNLEVVEVQKLISAGQLKMVDNFVTDRAFEEFCRRHGSAINMALIDPSTRRWLVSEYSVPEIVEEKKLPRAQKHALIVRACQCGRRIAGNVYFRHVRHCARAVGPRTKSPACTSG